MVGEQKLLAFRELTSECLLLKMSARTEANGGWCSIGPGQLRKVPTPLIRGQMSGGTGHVLAMLTCPISGEPRGSPQLTIDPIQQMVDTR